MSPTLRRRSHCPHQKGYHLRRDQGSRKGGCWGWILQEHTEDEVVSTLHRLHRPYRFLELRRKAGIQCYDNLATIIGTFHYFEDVSVIYCLIERETAKELMRQACKQQIPHWQHWQNVAKKVFVTFWIRLQLSPQILPQEHTPRQPNTESSLGAGLRSGTGPASDLWCSSLSRRNYRC